MTACGRCGRIRARKREFMSAILIFGWEVPDWCEGFFVPEENDDGDMIGTYWTVAND